MLGRRPACRPEEPGVQRTSQVCRSLPVRFSHCAGYASISITRLYLGPHHLLAVADQEQSQRPRHKGVHRAKTQDGHLGSNFLLISGRQRNCLRLRPGIGGKLQPSLPGNLQCGPGHLTRRYILDLKASRQQLFWSDQFFRGKPLKVGIPDNQSAGGLGQGFRQMYDGWRQLAGDRPNNNEKVGMTWRVGGYQVAAVASQFRQQMSACAAVHGQIAAVGRQQTRKPGQRRPRRRLSPPNQKRLPSRRRQWRRRGWQ